MPLYTGDGYGAGIGGTSLSTSGDWKSSVNAATTASITLSGLQTIDGVALADGYRVLVKDQVTGAQNGLYNASAGVWTRTSDASSDSQVTSGLVVTANSGTINGGTTWRLSTLDPIALGVTTLTFTTFGGGGGGGSAVGVKGDVQFRGATAGSFASSTNFNFSDTQQALTLGPAGTNLANNPISANGNVNSYVQSNVQNISNGTTASSDIVATADNGNDNTNYLDFGINSSGNTDATFTIVGANGSYAYSMGGNFAVGTGSASTDLLFFTTGTLAANERARVTQAGNFLIGRAAKAVGDTDGFLYLAAAPGEPTGVPTAFTGRTPVAIDSVDGDLLLYNNTWMPAGGPALIGRKAPCAWLPQTGTALTLWGMGATTAGTVSHPAQATTNYLTQMRRARFASAATAGSFAGARGPETIAWRGNAAGQGGFYFVCRFAMSTNLANARAFIGLYASTAALTNADPSSLNNVVGMSLDSADANWQIISNNQAGAAPKIDLGATFVKSTTGVYELRLWCAPNDTAIYYQALRVDTGTPTVVSGTLSADIPQNSVFLTPYVWITNNATASAAQIEISRLYLDSNT